MRFFFSSSAAIVLASLLPLMQTSMAYASPFSTDNGLSVTLSNGVAVTTACDVDSKVPAETINFARTASHSFYGYGINISAPGKQTSVDRVVNNVTALNLKWIRIDFGHPFRVKNNMPGPVNVTDEKMYEIVKKGMAQYLGVSPYMNYSGANPYIGILYNTLHDQKVKVIDVMFAIPDNYKITKTNNSGETANYIDPQHIKDFAQFYVAYLRALNDFKILPDMIELVNEPDGDWDPYYGPVQLESFESLVMTGLAQHHLAVNILAPGTSNVQAAPRYLGPFIKNGSLAGTTAISNHVYFTPNHFINGTIFDSQSPIDLPEFGQIVGVSKQYRKPIVITEFGGMDNTFDSIPSPTLDLKAALDLMRSGASVALVWDLIGDKYSLLDSTETPQPAYYAMQSLTTNIPDGANVLDIGMERNISERMSSLGYAAFEKDGQLIVGLANPGNVDKVVAIEFPGTQSNPWLDHITVNQLSSFDTSGVIQQSTNLVKSRCPVTVSVPAGSGIVLGMVKNDSQEPLTR